MAGSTKVKTPAPPQKSAEELDLLRAQTQQLRNLEQLQKAQFEQFQELIPFQRDAIQTQVKLANLSAQEAQRAAPFQEKTLATQAELLDLSKEEAKRRAQIDKLTLPAVLEAAGQRPVFDEAGNIVAIEKLPPAEKSELEKIQEQFALESAQESLRGIRGEVPVGDAFESRIAQDRTALRENLRRQLGPGFETSSPGIQALSEFEQRANEARENIRFGRLTQTAALSEIGADRLNQARLRELDILQRERASSIPGAFSMASGFGSTASESLARAFALSQNVSTPGSQSLERAIGGARLTGEFAGGIAGQFANDRRIIEQMNQQAALQSAANRASRTSGIFSALGTAAGAAAGFYFGGPAGAAAGGAAGGAAAGSSAAIKENKRPVDAGAVLEAVRHLSVEKWTYKPEVGLGTEDHIGPYAEEFQEAFGVGDGETISFIDAIGVLFAAVKVLANKAAPEGR